VRCAPPLVCVACALAACGGSPPPSLPWTDPAAPPPRREVVEEAEPDDGLQVRSTKGHMDPDAVNAGLAPRRAELTGCYTRNVGKRRWLGGKLLLHWEVAADGEITQVLLAESDLGAWPIEKCMLEVARAAVFGKPTGGAAELTLPLELGAPVPAAVWGVEQSARAVGGQLLQLETCAAGGDASAAPGRKRGAAAAKGAAAGRGQRAMPDEVAITLYVGPQGRPQSVGFASATAAIDDAWADCAERVALSWQLPDPKGQVTKLAVRYRPR
jgi:hypothetical protein